MLLIIYFVEISHAAGDEVMWWCFNIGTVAALLWRRNVMEAARVINSVLAWIGFMQGSRSRLSAKLGGAAQR